MDWENARLQSKIAKIESNAFFIRIDFGTKKIQKSCVFTKNDLTSHFNAVKTPNLTEYR
jgi:c-di-GMP-binding flagellar brake protein YcgR